MSGGRSGAYFESRLWQLSNEGESKNEPDLDNLDYTKMD
jgi:hypothetical protein